MDYSRRCWLTDVLLLLIRWPDQAEELVRPLRWWALKTLVRGNHLHHSVLPQRSVFINTTQWTDVYEPKRKTWDFMHQSKSWFKTWLKENSLLVVMVSTTSKWRCKMWYRFEHTVQIPTYFLFFICLNEPDQYTFVVWKRDMNRQDASDQFALV